MTGHLRAWVSLSQSWRGLGHGCSQMENLDSLAPGRAGPAFLPDQKLERQVPSSTSWGPRLERSWRSPRAALTLGQQPTYSRRRRQGGAPIRSASAHLGPSSAAAQASILSRRSARLLDRNRAAKGGRGCVVLEFMEWNDPDGAAPPTRLGRPGSPRPPTPQPQELGPWSGPACGRLPRPTTCP